MVVGTILCLTSTAMTENWVGEAPLRKSLWPPKEEGRTVGAWGEGMGGDGSREKQGLGRHRWGKEALGWVQSCHSFIPTVLGFLDADLMIDGIMILFPAAPTCHQGSPQQKGRDTPWGDQLGLRLCQCWQVAWIAPWPGSPSAQVLRHRCCCHPPEKVCFLWAAARREESCAGLQLCKETG